MVGKSRNRLSNEDCKQGHTLGRKTHPNFLYESLCSSYCFFAKWERLHLVELQIYVLFDRFCRCLCSLYQAVSKTLTKIEGFFPLNELIFFLTMISLCSGIFSHAGYQFYALSGDH